ncbi:DsbA family protein [Patescibacteria group bacterium]|nr:DsbA family protein [Patescibacteria group bacterium]
METQTAKSAPQEKKEGSDRYLIPAAIIVAGVLIAGAVYYSSVAQKTALSKDASGKIPNSPSVNVGELYGASDPMLGNPSAPVAVVEFSDFQCPFCGKFFRETEPQIIANYVKTGKVKFVYKDFAFLGDESISAAHAARCAGEQGKFWQYHDYLFKYMWDNYYGKGKSGENVGAFSEAHLLQFAGAVGLNQDDFSACMKLGKYHDAITASTDTGKQHGVNGTPGIFVNGTLIVGAQPYEEFAKAIDAALAGKK